jgi:hypothetical protein
LTATELLDELRRRGTTVLVVDDRVRVSSDTLDDELREGIRTHREELVRLLQAPTHPCSTCGRFSFPRPTVCRWCRASEPPEAA